MVLIALPLGHEHDQVARKVVKGGIGAVLQRVENDLQQRPRPQARVLLEGRHPGRRIGASARLSGGLLLAREVVHEPGDDEAYVERHGKARLRLPKGVIRRSWIAL